MFLCLHQGPCIFMSYVTLMVVNWEIIYVCGKHSTNNILQYHHGYFLSIYP